MQNSKLISAVKTLAVKEMRDFYEYLISPYYNKESSIIKMAELLKKSYPKFEIEEISKEQAYKILFPGKKYNDSVMRNIISKTLKHLENFLALKEFEKNTDYYRSLLFMRGAGEKNLDFLFSKADEKARDLIKTHPYRDSMYYFFRFMYEDELRRYNLRKESVPYLKEDNIQRVADSFSHFAITEGLRTYAVLYNANKHNKEIEHNLQFFESLLKVYEENRELFQDIHYANFYYNAIKLFISEEELYFDNIRKLVKEHYESLPEIDRKNVYVVQINFCAERINKGELHYMSQKLDIYKEILERKAHYEGLPYISHVLYNGIAFAAINMGEMDWAMEFIKRYRPELTDAHRDNSYHTVMAEYFLRSGKTEKALEHLSKVQRTDSLYKEEVYFILLKIFYSGTMTEQFYSEIDSFRNFIKESKQMSERRKKLAKSFVSLIKKLYALKEQKEIGQKPDLLSFRHEVLSNKYVSDKFWLLDKIRELESPLQSESQQE